MAQKKMKFWQKAIIFVSGIGNINWGLVAFGFNAVDSIFGSGSGFSEAIYALVGISGIYTLYWLFFGKK